jgi:type IV secretory pathway VirJ component
MIQYRIASLACVLATAVFPALAAAGAPETVELTIRGRSVPLAIYVPSTGTSPKGTVIIGSGDVGWVGLAVSVAEFLSSDGYVVAGVNVRRYLSAFTSGKDHVTVSQVAQDYRSMAEYLRTRRLLASPVIVSGVSEGAAMAVAAAAGPSNADWVAGVLTMGLPPTAELAWRWSDFSTWITKRDADEPSFAPADVIATIAPRPLWMIQSTHDEYVSEADYRRFEAAARAPKRLVLIDASNHRFTDRQAELQRQVMMGLTWIAAGGK